MIKAFVFDLDGTLYLGEKPIDGAMETVSNLVDQGYQIFYLTNNSGKTQQEIFRKLNGMGFDANINNTYCGSYAISVYLAQSRIAPVYVIGTENLKNELISFNVGVEDSSSVSAVVVGIDPFFSYNKITVALEAINRGAKLIVANTDPSYPAGDNRKLPGCGAMVGAIVGATGHIPDFHVGKPSVFMLELLCKEHCLSPTEICVVGDIPESDIAMANNFQCQSILFDPDGIFPNFPNKNKKVKNLREIILITQERKVDK